MMATLVASRSYPLGTWKSACHPCMHGQQYPAGSWLAMWSLCTCTAPLPVKGGAPLTPSSSSSSLSLSHLSFSLALCLSLPSLSLSLPMRLLLAPFLTVHPSFSLIKEALSARHVCPSFTVVWTHPPRYILHHIITDTTLLGGRGAGL